METYPPVKRCSREQLAEWLLPEPKEGEEGEGSNSATEDKKEKIAIVDVRDAG